MTTATKRRPARSKAERRAWVEAERARLDALVESLDPADRAEFEARFDGQYSLRNAALIGAQMPEATVVHGYVDWHEYGRHVRTGEHCRIRIYAYAGAYPDRTTTACEAQGAPAPAGEKKTRPRFNVVCVYDISQTDPDDEEETAA